MIFSKINKFVNNFIHSVHSLELISIRLIRKMIVLPQIRVMQKSALIYSRYSKSLSKSFLLNIVIDFILI